MTRTARGNQILTEAQTLFDSFRWARMDIHGRLLPIAGSPLQAADDRRAPGLAERLNKGEASYKWLSASLDAIGVEFGEVSRDAVLSVLRQFQTLQLKVEQLRAAEVEKEWLSQQRGSGSDLPGLDDQWDRVAEQLSKLDAYIFGAGDRADSVGLTMTRAIGDLEMAIKSPSPNP